MANWSKIIFYVALIRRVAVAAILDCHKTEIAFFKIWLTNNDLLNHQIKIIAK